MTESEAAEKVARRYLTTAAAAEVLGVSPRTMEGWRIKGRGPKCYRVGNRLVRYRREDLAAWLKKEAKRG